MKWTDERIEELTADWARGLSAGQIAMKLGHPHVTRNAVIGKVHRLGLQTRKVAVRKDYVAPNRPRRANRDVVGMISNRAKDPGLAKVRVNLSLDEFNALIPEKQRKTIFELTPWTCRWPVGHPGAAGFFFCGGLAEPTQAYCPRHQRFARQEGR